MKNLVRLFAFLIVIGTLFAIGYAITSTSRVSALPSYQVDINRTSVSGLSSGAYMAGQFQVVHSGIVVGAGIIAGGPYYCAGSFPFVPFVTTALGMCMNPKGIRPDGSALALKAATFSELGLIDDIANLKKERIYLFSGTKDRVVATSVVDQTVAFYKKIGVPEANIKYISDLDAGHAILTDNSADAACASTKSPYINDCNFIQSHELLRHIYGSLNPPATRRSGKLIAFDQREFIRSSISSMSDKAYAYVPQSCETQTCAVHIVFHGCAQGAADIGDRFHDTTGYNDMADANNIIVLYPQVERSKYRPINAGACWDFWGYSSDNPFAPNFYTKDAPQISAVKAMLDRLAKPRK